jgi:hypothetical protein
MIGAAVAKCIQPVFPNHGIARQRFAVAFLLTKEECRKSKKKL